MCLYAYLYDLIDLTDVVWASSQYVNILVVPHNFKDLFKGEYFDLVLQLE